VFALLLLAVTGLAGDFEVGNELFDEGKFAEAKQRYETLIEAGQGSANVYYNLGNADYRLGSAGRAMLNYERALALNPGHKEAAANLKLLREQTSARLPEETWETKVFGGLPINAWTLAAVAAGWITLFSIVVLATSRRAANGGVWFLLIVAAAGLGVSVTGVRMGMKDLSLGVITAKQAEAKLQPAESAGVAAVLPAGSRVRVLSERGPWTYCELPGAGRGWIPQGMVEKVRPGHS
jgi:tetratricopeptide (TPR) repeat protein